MTAVTVGDEACGSSKSTSNIEYLFFGTKVELAQEIFGCLTTTDMKLIHRREIIDGYGFDRLAKKLDPTLDRSN